MDQNPFFTMVAAQEVQQPAKPATNPFFTVDSPTPSQNPFFSQEQPKSSDPWENFQQTASEQIKKRGLPSSVLPVLVGQAALESARGSAAPGNNYFGIKGQGTAGSNNLATQEYGNGGYYGENSNFRAYNSPEESINDYLDLISHYPGVAEAMATNDPSQILSAIEDNGYATSPTYVQNVMNTPEFKKYANIRE